MSSARNRFKDRHIGPGLSEIEYMLKEIGQNSLSDFIANVVPTNIAIQEKLDLVLPSAISEVEAVAELRLLANKNLLTK